MKFKVGQIWKDRAGYEYTIKSIDEDKRFPLETEGGFLYSKDGKWWDNEEENELDLIELFRDAEELNLSNPSSEDTSELVDTSNGLSASYYVLPIGATQIQDLIEHKEMNFSQGNILKAIYRLGSKSNIDAKYDLEKIVYFAERELKRIQK